VKDSYILYRKDGKTAVVLITENDDQLFYVLNKLQRTRDRELKKFAKNLIEEYFKNLNESS
jgi:hypothetical protein